MPAPEFQSPTERAEARLRFEQRLIEHLHGLATTENTPRIVLLPRSAGDEHLTI